MENLAQGYALLARNVPSTRLSMNTVRDTFDGTSSLNIANRYFTQKRDNPNASSIPFSHEIDPLGILTAVAGETYIHTEDNVVNFYKRTTDSDGDYR